PASHFTSKIIIEKIDAPVIQQKATEKTKVPTIQKPVTVEKQTAVVSTGKRRHSALSFKSLSEKKELKEKVTVVEKIDENLPSTPFTTKKVQELWDIYTQQVLKKGEQLLASLLRSCQPIANGNMLELELPNSSLKVNLEKAKPIILRFIKPELNNYYVDFDITVNEEAVKKFAYTPQEKFDYLKDKNKLIAVFKNKFDLEL
ncbi:MAG: DNA polymerase III subunit gamma/tau, partial [Flavobacteriaceae bacterium]